MKSMLKARKYLILTLFSVTGILLIWLFWRWTVNWEESVRLNTGEVIKVQRSSLWQRPSMGPGDQFFKMAPMGDMVTSFEYRGMKYVFKDDVRIGWIVISPITGRPVLIGHPGTKDWSRVDLLTCRTPFYVQLDSTPDGTKWTVRSELEAWTYGLPYNLLYNNIQPGESLGSPIDETERNKRDMPVVHWNDFMKKIEPNHSSKTCLRK